MKRKDKLSPIHFPLPDHVYKLRSRYCSRKRAAVEARVRLLLECERISQERKFAERGTHKCEPEWQARCELNDWRRGRWLHGVWLEAKWDCTGRVQD